MYFYKKIGAQMETKQESMSHYYDQNFQNKSICHLSIKKEGNQRNKMEKYGINLKSSM